MAGTGVDWKRVHELLVEAAMHKRKQDPQGAREMPATTACPSGCRCNAARSEPAEPCVIDLGAPGDCTFAVDLLAAGKGRDDCQHWHGPKAPKKPVPTGRQWISMDDVANLGFGGAEMRLGGASSKIREMLSAGGFYPTTAVRDSSRMITVTYQKTGQPTGLTDEVNLAIAGLRPLEFTIVRRGGAIDIDVAALGMKKHEVLDSADADITVVYGL
jgi:hypothetical protein